MLWPKENSYKEFDNEKKFLRLENFRKKAVLEKKINCKLKLQRKGLT